MVIVSYNVVGLLRECLASIEPDRARMKLEVFVVDNASADGSADMVAAEFPWARLLRSEENLGYPRGNNVALREARGRHVLLLNPDTRLPAGALWETVAYMDEHPDVGALGPKLVRADGSLDLACRRSFPSPGVAFFRLFGLARLFPRSARLARYNLLDVDPDTAMDVDSVCGAFMLVRGEVVEQVGLLDESFFMYGEDLDWAYRMKQVGWRVRYQPSVVVLHHKGQSSRQRPARSTRAFYGAMHRFYDKHYARSRPAMLNALVHVGIRVLMGRTLVGQAFRGRGHD